MIFDHDRSFATGSEVAHIVPSQTCLSVTPSVYTDASKGIPFVLSGLQEEIVHSDQTMNGHVRSIHLLERDSQAALDALITGHEDISTAKERIIQNELACTRLYNTCAEFVETLDQYTLQAFADKVAGMDTTAMHDRIRRNHDHATPKPSHEVTPGTVPLYGPPEQFRDVLEAQDVDATAELGEDTLLEGVADTPAAKERCVALVAQRVVSDRGTSSNDVFAKLVQLEQQFGTAFVPKLAGYMALNIPIVDMEAAPTARAEALASIDVHERFETIYTTLMNDVEPTPTPTATDGVWDDQLKQYIFRETDKDALDTLLDEVISGVDIDTALRRRAEPPLPLLDLPLSKTPTYVPIITNLFQNDALDAYPSLVEDFLSDAFIAFASLGCVCLCTENRDPIGYLPNAYLHSTHVGTRFFWAELFEFLAATGVINELVTQSIANTPAALHCPFCGADHDPRQGNCTWDAFLSPVGTLMARPSQWSDYVGQTAPLVEEFVTTPVPGEAQLAAERNSLGAAG